MGRLPQLEGTEMRTKARAADSSAMLPKGKALPKPRPGRRYSAAVKAEQLEEATINEQRREALQTARSPSKKSAPGRSTMRRPSAEPPGPLEC